MQEVSFVTSSAALLTEPPPVSAQAKQIGTIYIYAFPMMCVLCVCIIGKNAKALEEQRYRAFLTCSFSLCLSDPVCLSFYIYIYLIGKDGKALGEQRDRAFLNPYCAGQVMTMIALQCSRIAGAYVCTSSGSTSIDTHTYNDCPAMLDLYYY